MTNSVILTNNQEIRASILKRLIQLFLMSDTSPAGSTIVNITDQLIAKGYSFEEIQSALDALVLEGVIQII